MQQNQDMYEQQIKEIYERCDSIKATIKKAGVAGSGYRGECSNHFGYPKLDDLAEKIGIYAYKSMPFFFWMKMWEHKIPTENIVCQGWHFSQPLVIGI